MAGVTAQGFVAKTVTDLVNDLNAGWRSVLGAFVNVDPRSRNGQKIAALAGPLAEGWQLAEAIAGAFSNPSGLLLDYVAALTGTTRRAATFSQVLLSLTGVPTTVVPSGKIAGVNGTTALFAVTANTTLTVMAAWTTGATITPGARRTANGNVYSAVQGGVTAGAGTGPAGTGQAIVDNTVIWRFLGVGTASADVNAIATVSGPLQGYSGTITVISTPFAGWQGVQNLLDAVPGAIAETDPQLRTRRATEAAGQGRSPLDSMRAQLLRSIPNVTSVFMFENTSDQTIDGMSPHSVEALVAGGDDADVAAAIFANKAGGPATSGTSAATVVDSEGNGHVINFSRRTTVNVYEVIVVAVDVTAFPVNGAAQIQDALVAAGNALGQGADVYARAVEAAIFARDTDGNLIIPGVLDVQSHFVGTAPNPVTTTVAITQRQISAFDTSRTTVTIVPGNP